jgi:hypothetical protein
MAGALWVAALSSGGQASAQAKPKKAAAPRADDGAAHRGAVDHGAADQALLEGRFEEAAEGFRRAGQRTPPALLWFLLARQQAKAGNLVHAHELLALVNKELSDAKPSSALGALRREAAEHAEVLDLRTPKVTISVRRAGGRDLRVSLDGRRVWTGQIQRVNPGEHEVLAETDGARSQRRFLAVEGREALVELVMPPPRRRRARRSAPPPIRSPFADGPSTPAQLSPEQSEAGERPPDGAINWLGPGVVWALGSFVGIVSVSASVVAESKADDILAQCVDNVCPASLIDEVQEVEDLDDLSVGTGIAAGAFGVLGALMVLVQVPSDEGTFALGPGSVQFRTHF